MVCECWGKDPFCHFCGGSGITYIGDGLRAQPDVTTIVRPVHDKKAEEDVTRNDDETART